MSTQVQLLLLLLAPMTGRGQVRAERVVLLDGLRHLRVAGPREWSEFPESPEANRLDVKFEAMPNPSEWTCRLRQQDVKQTWQVSLNAAPLGQLRIDENDMVIYFAVPPKALKEGENLLRVEQRGATPDDVRIGEISFDSRPVNDVLSEGRVEVDVLDADSGTPMPARITILNAAGAMQSCDAASNDHLAVRPGLVYTSTGKAGFGLPAGDYTLFAGRGFEYSLASTRINVRPGKTAAEMLTIRREVTTEGYVACDTHTHTLTHSGHGDATVQERMITLAAEGIELPIATDHNVHVDQEPFARSMKVRQYFTPVIGNEVTTPVGHFNIFPIQPGAKPPAHELADWNQVLDGIFHTPGVKVAILNHARDLHRGVRPFGPKWHNAVVGENVNGWPIRFNAMEIVNSSATQTDPMRLVYDWMGLLNRGHSITPVGASDSHDVGRHFVGQGRTYIRCNDRDPGNIDVAEAVASFLAGRVIVSYGLLAELTVNGRHRSGDLAPAADEIKVDVRVLGPSWIAAHTVELYANGSKVFESSIPQSASDLPTGVKWQGSWMLPKPNHDLHLVAVARGPGIAGPHWKTAKPYQPTSPDWSPQVIGCSGAVWVDADADGRRTSARDHAANLVKQAAGKLPDVVARLADYDEAVAAHAAYLLHQAGVDPFAPSTQAALDKATPAVKTGFHNYRDAWRQGEIARAER